jgi:thiosulfate/3-mercaptopyruvate sulfurtransferase
VRAAESGVLVDVDWIAARLGDPDVQLVEIDVSRAAYDEGHIPGAVLWNAYSDLRDQSYGPIAQVELGRLLSQSGVTRDGTVVVYGYGAPLGFWLLKEHGHADVRMLSGSREQWPESGHEWATDVPKTVDSSEPERTEDTRILATREAVNAAIGDARHVILDVRSDLEYSGERFWPSGAAEDAGRSGHIPGAVSVPIDMLRAEDGTSRSADELQAVFDHAGVTKDKSVIVYCTIGNRASEAWFALSYLLDYPDVRVYYGSWVDWGKAADTPIDN